MPRSVLMTILLATLFQGVAVAQSATKTQLVEEIDAYVEPFNEAGHLSGAFLVAKGDDIFYEKSWGLADRQRKIVFQTDTPSCIASVSKPTTIIIAARLIEDGTISLKDPISKWLQDFPHGETIVVRHLLFHQSGIPHRLTTPDNENQYRSAQDMVDLASGVELDFEPGTARRYSSGGYSVLVRILEVASGKTYQELLSDTILKPLALQHTFHPTPKVDLARAAKSYSWTASGRQLATMKDYSFLVGAGSLFSTPQEMFKISRALVAGEFGEQAKRQLLRGGRLRWNGITNHYRAYLEYDSRTDVTIAMVSNQMTGANDLLRQNVPKIVAGEAVEIPKVPRPKFISIPESTLRQFAGRYQIAGSPMPVRARNGALFANDWVLLPTTETTFYSPQDYASVEVVMDHGGPVALDWAGMRCPRLGPLEPTKSDRDRR